MESMTRDISKHQPGSWAPTVEETKLLMGRVRAAVYRCCPPYLASQAEDIAQEVLVRLVRKLNEGEGKPSFSSMYLLKAAHGVTVDEIRRRARRRERSGLEDTMEAQIHERPDPEQEASGRSLGRAIRDCLDGIVATRRVAVTLRLLGCSLAEIAKRLECPLKSADNRVYRGMTDLRKCLESKGLTP